MTKHEPWEPGCIVLTPKDFDCKNGLKMFMAAIAANQIDKAITQAMRSSHERS